MVQPPRRQEHRYVARQRLTRRHQRVRDPADTHPRAARTTRRRRGKPLGWMSSDALAARIAAGHRHHVTRIGATLAAAAATREHDAVIAPPMAYIAQDP